MATKADLLRQLDEFPKTVLLTPDGEEKVLDGVNCDEVIGLPSAGTVPGYTAIIASSGPLTFEGSLLGWKVWLRIYPARAEAGPFVDDGWERLPTARLHRYHLLSVDDGRMHPPQVVESALPPRSES